MALEKLQRAILRRGQNNSLTSEIDLALLAHERWRGRTEEDYGQEDAHRELMAIIERIDGRFPAQRGHEYTGLTQLRSYVHGHRQARAQAEAWQSDDDAKAAARAQDEDLSLDM